MRRILLFWGDIGLLYLSLLLTLLLRYGHGAVFAHNWQIHWLPFTLIFALWTLVFYISNLYEISYAQNSLAFYGTFLYSTLVNILLSVVLFYFVALFKITPRVNLFIFLAIELGLAVGWRYFFNRAVVRSNQGNNTLILGATPQAQELYDWLLTHPQLGYNALGIVDIQHGQATEILEDLIRRQQVRVVVLDPATYAAAKIIDILYSLLGLKLVFYNLADFYERVSGKVPVGAIDQAWFLENLSEGGQRAYELAKRFFDILLSLTVGILTLPFQLLIALAIKLDSPGPVIYRQQRIGRTGQVFTLVKYRTMFTDAEAKTGPVWASENDERTTRVGRFIRRTRLDELPQIWNVLRGEMSFIGPRPERPEFHSKLKANIPFYQQRYLVRPGLTGWTQIKYRLDFKGGLTIADTLEKLQYDLFYIKNRSLLLDLGILLKTLNIVARKLFR